MKDEKLRIITTSNLAIKKSAFRKQIITTKDIELPVQRDEEEEKPDLITTKDVKGGKEDEK